MNRLMRYREVLSLDTKGWSTDDSSVGDTCRGTEADAADMVLNKVIDYIRREYNISHVIIQIERHFKPRDSAKPTTQAQKQQQLASIISEQREEEEKENQTSKEHRRDGESEDDSHCG
ncbi:hypothetical protein Bca52824_093649 [Brassica carinata]|uniref:Uncharacterized protein n=1 Tax=Brassica carinata TaxID=52824 RepID=A0A8X7P5E2_BRACI|nr:hypothetical protein Bca52824_093649 [Brassica carinata]